MNKRIIIITQGLSRIVEPLVEAGNISVVGIIECAPRTQANQSGLFRFYKQKIKKSKLYNYTENKNIPYFYFDSLTGELKAWVKSFTPDLIVVYSMSRLLKREVFEIPEYGTINLHPSLLPKYRGPNPWFWTYYNMERKAGVTVHYIDDGEDTGNILLQEEFEIPLGMRSPEMQDLAIGKIGTGLLMKVIPDIERITPIKQPELSPTPRARNIKLSEYHSIINWKDWETEHIWHVLRGTELWLNAITPPKGIYRGSRWRIMDYKKGKNDLESGRIYRKNGKRFIACNDGVIFITCSFDLKKFIISFL